MSKIVGVKIDTRSPNTKDRIYYYNTEKDFKRGEQLRVSVPSGGMPKATVAVGDSKKKFSKPLKDLETR